MKPIWIMLITIILTGAVIGGGVYYWQNKKITNVKNDLNSQITTLQKQVTDLKEASGVAATSTPTTNTVDETANWKTYTNEAYGFSFKYPSDWSILKFNWSSDDHVAFGKTDIIQEPRVYIKLEKKPIGGTGAEGLNFNYQAVLVDGKLQIISLDQIGAEIEKSIKAAKAFNVDPANKGLISPTDITGDAGGGNVGFGANEDSLLSFSTQFNYYENTEMFRALMSKIVSTFRFTK